jgi:multidrug efflux pump subunit AcrA (membrane-fusion protein)
LRRQNVGSIRRSLGLIAGLLFIAGCASKEEAPKAEGKRSVVTGVKVETVGLQPFPEAVEAVGTVRSRKQSVLAAKITASVVAVHPREGDRVKAGQVVVELDDQDVKAQLGRAEAGLREAKNAIEEIEAVIQAQEKAIDVAKAHEELTLATLARYKVLLERRSVAPQEYDEVSARSKTASAELQRAREVRASLSARKSQALAKIDQAEEELHHAQVVFSYTTIRAPFDGIIVAKAVEVGNLASPGVPLVTVEEERYRLEAGVQESEIKRIRTGQQAEVKIDALGRKVSGPIMEIVPAADPQSRTFTVKIDLLPMPGLRSGFYGTTRFVVGRQQVLAIPRKAVVERGQLEGVYVLDREKIARLRLVKTGKVYGDQIEILAGLSEGERVVTEGVERVSDGSHVESGG